MSTLPLPDRSELTTIQVRVRKQQRDEGDERDDQGDRGHPSRNMGGWRISFVKYI